MKFKKKQINQKDRMSSKLFISNKDN